MTNLALKLANYKVLKDENKFKKDNTPELDKDLETAEVNDYERYDIIDTEQLNIARIIGDLVMSDGIDLEISVNGIANKELSERFKQGARNTDFFEILQLGLEHSLLRKHSVLRITGDIDNPVLYLTQSAVLTWDKADKQKIKKLYATFQINDGAEVSSLVTEHYDWKTGILFSSLNNGRSFYKKHVIASIKRLPYVMFIPAKNPFNARAKGYFENSEYHAMYLNAMFNKKMTYAEYVHYHILPDKSTIQMNGGMRLWKNKILKNIVILRKDQINMGTGARESIDKIEPNMDYLIKISSAYNDAGKIFSDSLGIQNPSFEGTKQMSEHEIKVLKQKEDIVVGKLKIQVEKTIEYILWFFIDAPFASIKVKLNDKKILTKNDIDNKRFEAEQEDKKNGGQTTPKAE